MAKFLVLYLAPAKVIEDWSKTDPSMRQDAEENMRNDWNRWMSAHAAMITLTEAAGKTKRATARGIADVKNDVMLYSFVEAESHEVAAKAFEDHPHLQIPEASIDVMEVRSLSA